MINKSEYCGAEFETHKKYQKYCNRRCYMAARRSRHCYLAARRQSPYKKVCEYCGAEFETYEKHQKYCSRRCYMAARRQSPYKKVCEYCGAEFETHKEHQRYCSVACSNKDDAKRRDIPEKKCLRCGKLYKPRAYNQKYCSEERRQKRDLEVRNCIICGEVLTSGHANRKYCDECLREIYKKPNSKKKCAQCGREFEPVPLNRKYCSEKCALAAKMRQAAESREQSRDYRIKQRERRRRFYEKEPPSVRECECCEKTSLPENRKVSAHLNLDEMVRQASMCGLSYGKYKAELARGKTFEELRAKYESERQPPI